MQDGNPIKKDLKISTAERIKQYREQREKVDAFLSENPQIPYLQKEADRQAIQQNVMFLDVFYKELIPYVKKVRTHVNDVSDQNKITATYLLLGKATQGMSAIFLLAQNGFHYEVMEIVRSTQEALDLAFYFMRGDETNPDLIKWFEGNIVKNSATRKQMQEFAEENTDGDALPFDEIKAGIYGGLSSYTHVSYASLLDLFDVYNKDFDFEKIAGYHYVSSSSLPYVKGLLESLIISLKYFYQKVGDLCSYQELSVLLKKIAPDIDSKEKIERLEQAVFERWK